ncbi:helix-turn-helix transcriptional regulator [Thalassospira marina]|uniref:AraC family transcriptional regulator n=1 Tax=Thalassospira marina TaxID=2048283 RepID=A0A2N3KSB7_9PROT|nr:AraC family transcriptional regulator [Thalassospira marina]AUG51420.1 AraC family transcriptional regulator [Thalassospira marina]PKR53479.1 AraC family transcriptional regulator [Thalassospira marina]
MQEFVSFGLQGALIRQLAWLPQGYDLVPDATVMTAGRLRSVMLQLEEAAGSYVLVKLGRHLALKEQAPVLTMLRYGGSPDLIVERWRRLESYSHARGRTEHSTTSRSITLHRGSVRGQAPSRVENLLLHGFIVGLLEAIGVEGITSVILPSHGSAVTMVRNGKLVKVRDFAGRGLRWRISWQSFVPVSQGYPFMANMPGTAPAALTGRPVIRKLAAILENDVGRGWTIDEVAHQLETSARTLQRRLQTANTRFSDLLRLTRVREACRLISGTQMSIGEIGYWCGFTDNAHFSRDFRRLVGMPPSVYREASLGHAGLTRA